MLLQFPLACNAPNIYLLSFHYLNSVPPSTRAFPTSTSCLPSSHKAGFSVAKGPPADALPPVDVANLPPPPAAVNLPPPPLHMTLPPPRETYSQQAMVDAEEAQDSALRQAYEEEIGAL